MDGGVCERSNNPSEIAWREVCCMHIHREIECRNRKDGIKIMVSLGTGKKAQMSIFSRGNFMHQTVRILKAAVRSLTHPEPVHQSMEDNHSPVYRRFNVEVGMEQMKLDECRISKDKHNQTLDRILRCTDRYLPTVEHELHEVARILVKQRRARCERGHGCRYRGLSKPGPLGSPYLLQMRTRRNILSEDSYLEDMHINGFPAELSHSISTRHNLSEMADDEHPAQLRTEPRSPIYDEPTSTATMPGQRQGHLEVSTSPHEQNTHSTSDRSFQPTPFPTSPTEGHGTHATPGYSSMPPASRGPPEYAEVEGQSLRISSNLRHSRHLQR